jgi:hypothetical protein
MSQCEEVQGLHDQLVDQAKDVAEIPYLQSSWMRRGNTLLSLGYPELSAGHAYRAIRLCNTELCYDPVLGAKVRFIVGIWLMLQDPEAVCL